jgi:hypothetical protein
MAPPRCSYFFFSIVSFITLGGTLALLITAFIFLSKFELLKADSRILACLIAALIVAFLILVFSVYSSFNPKNWGRWILTVVFALYSLGIVAIGIIALAFLSKVLKSLGDLWKDPDASPNQVIIGSIEHGFNCCGWNSSRVNCTVNPARTCEDIVTQEFKKYVNWVGSLLLVVGVVLMIAAIFACRVLLRSGQDSDHDAPDLSHGSQLSEPLVKGSGSRSSIRYSW